MEWSTLSGGAMSTSTTRTHGAGAAGVYALRCNGLTSTTPSFLREIVTATTVQFVRFYLCPVTLPSGTNRIAQWSSGGTMIVAISLNSDGTLTLSDEDGTIGTSTKALDTADFFRIELKLDRTAAGGSHVVELKIDGTVAVTSSARNLSAGPAQWNLGGNLASEAQTQGDWYFDDVAINDSAAGGTQTGYPGEGFVVILHPDGQDDSIGPHTVPNTIVGGDTFEWQAIDDNPTPDDTTTRLDILGTGAFYATLTATPDHMGSSAVVSVVGYNWRMAASANSLCHNVNFILRQNGSNTSLTGVTSSVNTYRTGSTANTTDTADRIVRYTNAGNSNAVFTKADLDSTVYAGFQRAASNTSTPRITSVWVQVDYYPSPAPPFNTPRIRPLLMRR
jgi:hypothetical protein